MKQRSFLGQIPTPEQFQIITELGVRVAFEYWPAGQLPEDYEMLELPHDRAVYLQVTGNTIDVIDRKCYERNRAQVK